MANGAVLVRQRRLERGRFPLGRKAASGTVFRSRQRRLGDAAAGKGSTWRATGA